LTQSAKRFGSQLECLVKDRDLHSLLQCNGEQVAVEARDFRSHLEAELHFAEDARCAVVVLVECRNMF
jgi:hypothetical protein